MLKSLVISFAALIVPIAARAQPPPPIIDMHLHANTADSNGPPPMGICVPFTPSMPPHDQKGAWGEVFIRVMKEPPCADPIWSPTTDAALIEQTVAILERRNIIGVLSGPAELVLRWRETAPDRFIPAVAFLEGGIDFSEDLSPESMRRLFESGNFEVLGEVESQYGGIAPNDERMQPYWALSEELDIPVGIHMGEGPPGVIGLLPKYRAGLTSPYLLEDVLVRHPRLRVYVMHYGSPLVDEMIAMLATYPGLYVDIGGMQYVYKRPYFYEQLRHFIDAGFGKRVMFGSDQVQWPGLIEPSIAIVEEAPFLNEGQKRDIFYNNAARFLRLSEEEVARHHGR